LVIAGGIEDWFAELRSVLADHADVLVGHQQAHAHTGVGPTQADMAEAADVAQGDPAMLVHPVAARALQRTMSLGVLQRPDERIKALVDMVSELAIMDEPRKRLAGIISGLDIHYDLGEGHPLLGRRMPDLDLATADGPLRVFTLLHDAKPVLLNLGEPGGLDITPWADRVQLIDAEYVGLWELPVLGAVSAPTAVLLRPDGYVAWVGDGTDTGLRDALTTWFGTP
jgi:hypothetical protein